MRKMTPYSARLSLSTFAHTISHLISILICNAKSCARKFLPITFRQNSNMTQLLAIKYNGPKLPCTVQPFTPTVPRGFPEGLLCGTLGDEEQRCMGAVCHPSLSPCLAQLPPGVLRRTLGRVAVNTANSMMNERSRAHHTCVDTTRSVALLTQQYGTTGWRSMRAVRLCASHPDHSLRDPSSVDIRWSQFLREPRLMDTEGSLGLCGWKAGAAPAPGRHLSRLPRSCCAAVGAHGAQAPL